MNTTAIKRDAIVLIPACSNLVGLHPSHTVQRKYTDAVFYGSQCTPLFFPAMGAELDVNILLDHVHGVFLSGSPSNVNATLYGEDITQPHLPQDPLRDGVTLPLIKTAVERGIPILGVCRGFQEINVAFGGTLHQAVHELEDFGDHREDKSLDLEEQYGPAHPLQLVDGGLLHRILGKHKTTVNSLHGQGINRLGEGLVAEAHAPDGLVEAFHIAEHPNFGLAVQWHPEWKMHEHPDSRAIFDAFGAACRRFAAQI
ncbi:gamma-glutamyl-gamma-aminobutyrate hydrolase family protein [Hydromonas duriensis]|uniref:gamma-glutamyl-gamma-aminobutyrate hydrolase n=1 Tax=Hydromonas duriensis TaxID=1527608 RepID=A0A4R6Y6C1_9BURK|nr:gamma-glutamyl-gamma-aminobutyrate hydrolase family protein [Hydromonas duriensis]TDR31159.1 gamma-glutamyl-gamma-aminobutyrate hydrolase [Hydromonas duriensis]